MENNTWNAPLHQWNDPEFGSSTACQTIEIFQCEGEMEPRILEGDVDDSTLVEWLEKDPSVLSDLKIPVSGLRLLIGYYNSYSFSVTKKASSLIEQHLDLHENFWVEYTTEHCCASSYYTFHTSARSKLGDYRLLFKVPWSSTNHFQLCLTYSPSSQLTTILLFISDTFLNPTFVLNLLKSQARFHTYPLLLPILLAEAFINNKRMSMQQITREVSHTGAATGQRLVQGEEIGDMMETNFEETTADLNDNGNRLEGYLFRVRAMRAALIKLRTWGEMVNSSSSKGLNNHQLQDENKNMQLNKLSYLEDTCDSLLLALDSVKNEIQLLLQVVYQFMAQKEARVNTSLAKTSAAIAKASKADSEVMKVIAIQTKRDSSAMKTIAILGMFFLPGTFIAAILSMPVFDLSNTPGGVIKHGLRIYWALTISLTVIVFLCWIAAVTVPWRKLVGKVGWKKRFFGPNTDVVNLELDVDDDDEDDDKSQIESETKKGNRSKKKDEGSSVKNQDREKNDRKPVEVTV